MRRRFLVLALSCTFFCTVLFAQTPRYDQTRAGFLVFHPIQTDDKGDIIPWAHQEYGIAYDSVIRLVWNFWDTMRRDFNGLPYYMNHQVWRPVNDPRGIGGDQLAMALSSWLLLYQYTGNEQVKENMKFIADYYLTHSLSAAAAKWPGIPFPYNTLMYSGVYDGDMILGKDFTQPDKAGSFGWELVRLYKITGREVYLNHAVRIANTLAVHTRPGNAQQSPLPFKVNAYTGEIGVLKTDHGKVEGLSEYTTNWAGTLNLWLALVQMKKGRTEAYKAAADKVVRWMNAYPLQTNRWGPFFEDISGWSDTQINAVTFASFMMAHPHLFPEWRQQVQRIFAWVEDRLGNNQWQQHGVRVVNEQTAYQTPGNSHTARQGAAALQYVQLTGDTTGMRNAIKQLNWATYMVDVDGKNNYPRDEVWLTDGYGDYVRHYLQAMAFQPELAPSNANHILSTTSVITEVGYRPDFNKRLAADVKQTELEKLAIFYKTYDAAATEVMRLVAKPASITVNDALLPEMADSSNGWNWRPLAKGGVLTLRHTGGKTVKVFMP